MFYNLFENLCKQRGESVAHACKEIGIFPTTAHDWKSGARPRNSTVKRIADYFGVDVSYFDENTASNDEFLQGFVEELRSNNTLTDDEQLLLAQFRALSDAGKNELIVYAMKIKAREQMI